DKNTPVIFSDRSSRDPCREKQELPGVIRGVSNAIANIQRAIANIQPRPRQPPTPASRTSSE
ncbi:MAG: hypothetical protein WBD83_19295, partial [Xanthobacteraceae bacterium]